MKLATLYTKQGKLRGNIQKTINAIYGTKIYTDQWVGSGRRKSLQSIHNNVVVLLDVLKLKYKTGNDAPKGGQEGNYIEISSRALAKIKNLKTEI